MMIAGKTLDEWAEFARRDDCLDRMVPSDLRQLVGCCETLRVTLSNMVEDGDMTDRKAAVNVLMGVWE